MFELVEKYINGKLTAEELARLRSFFDTRSDEELTAVMRKIWETNDGRPAPMEEQLRRMKDKIDAHLGMERESLPKEKTHRLTLSDWLLRVAALLLPLFVIISLYLMDSNREMNNQMKNSLTFVTDKGQLATVNLPDGSVVELNQDTKLEYNAAAFRGAERRVKLEGEAFFKVKHKEDASFVVGMEDAEVTVLGTEFNVEARRKKGDVTVILEKGRLSVAAMKTRKSEMLSSGDIAVVNRRTGNIAVTTMGKVPVRVDWRNKSLVFQNAPLKEVLRELTEAYGTGFKLGRIRNNYRFNGVLPTDNLSEAIKIVSESCNLKVRRMKNGFSVSDL